MSRVVKKGTAKLITSEELSRLEGELLTIIDAATEDKERREALKSLIRNTLWDCYNDVLLPVLVDLEAKTGQEWGDLKFDFAYVVDDKDYDETT